MSSTADSSSTSQLPVHSHSHALEPNNNVLTNYSFLLVRRLVLSILSLFAIISLVDFIIWRIIHPLPPVFQVTSFGVSSSTDIYDIRFAIRNPNQKLSLAMQNIEILVFHGKNMVSRRERMPPMYLKKMISGPRDYYLLPHLHGKLVVKFESIDHQWSNGESVIKFDVKVNFGVKYLAWSWLTKRADMEIFCRDLSLRFLSAQRKGDLIGGRRECSARFL